MNKPKERPVIFSTQEVNAVLAGDKTQHRVLVDFSDYGQPEFMGSRDCDKDLATNWGWDNCEDVDILYLTDLECQLGAIGDRLWVKERLKHRQPSNVDCCMQWAYSSDNSWALNSGIPVNAHKKTINASAMPRWASRILLEITDIRIERVQDITLGDSLKEARDGLMDFAADYWMAKHGEAAWFTNPWVWVIEFKVVENSEVTSG